MTVRRMLGGWHLALALLLAAILPAAAQIEPLRAAALAKAPWAKYAGLWEGEASGAGRAYTLRLAVRTGQTILDGNSGLSGLRCGFLAPAGLQGFACFSFGDPDAGAGLKARMIGESGDRLAGLFAPSTGMADLALSPSGDGLTLTGKFGDSDIRLTRVVPQIERVEITEIDQSRLTLDLLRRQWATYREQRGNWSYWASGSGPLVLRLRGANFPLTAPVGSGALTSPGLIVPDDPHLELVEAITLPDGALKISFMLHEGVVPGTKRVTVSGVPFEFELRILGMEGSPPPPEPVILDAVALDDQDRLAYPAGNATSTRRLFVAGIGLPKSRAGLALTKVGGDAGFAYQIDATPADAAAGTTAGRDFARGWELTGLSPSDSVSGLTVNVRFAAGARPGPTGIAINGASGAWLLAFADNSGRLDVVRHVRDGEDEPAEAVLAGEAIYVDAWVNAPLLEKTLELELATIDKLDRPVSGTLRVAALRVGQKGRQVQYRAGPLALDLGPDGLRSPPGSLVVRGGAGGKLFARAADPDLVRFEPAVVATRTELRPRDLGATWDEAVEVAGRCVDLDLAAAKQQLSRQVADVTRFIVAFAPRMNGNEHLRVDLGTHAAALLLRQAFKERLATLRDNYRQIADNPTALRGFRLYMAKEANNDRQPLNRVTVHDTDGREIPYGNVFDIGRAARLAPDRRAAWQDAATREALEGLIDSMAKSLDLAQGSACDVEKQVLLTSLAFDDIVAGVAPTLMKERVEADGSRRWEPDLVARAYLKAVAGVGESIRTLGDFQRTARGLTGVVLLPAFFAAGPLLASEGVVGFMIGLGLTSLDAGLNAADLRDHFADRTELAFAEGAAPLIGLDRLDVIGGTAAGPIGIAMSALGTVLPGVNALSSTASRLARTAAVRTLNAAAERGAALARTRPLTREAVAAMSEAQRSETAAYYAVLKAREAAEGAGAIDAGQRAFMNGVETLALTEPIFPALRRSAPAAAAAPNAGAFAGARLAHEGGEIALGGRLNRGGVNEVYAVAGRDDLIVRVRPADTPEDLMERFGRAAMTGDHPAVRAGAYGRVDPEVIAIAPLKGGGTGKSGVLAGRRYEIVERVPGGSYKEVFGARPMSPGQADAVNRGLRELNRAGFAFTDCHTGNFALVPAGGADRWKMVVLDPGGIVPAQGSDLAARAANARTIQQAIASPNEMLARSYNAAVYDGRIGAAAAEATLAAVGRADRTRIDRIVPPLVDHNLLFGRTGRVPDELRGTFMRPLPMAEQAAARRLFNAEDPAAELARLRAEARTQPRRRLARVPRRPCAAVRRQPPAPPAARWRRAA